MMDTAEKLVALKREVALRRRVYPKWVKDGRMKIRDAEYQIKVMEEIVADYERQADDAG